MSASRWRSYGDVDAAADPRSLGDQLDDIAGVPFVAAEKHGFDACRADRTLQHVEQPDRALAEMVRVTRGLGRVVVSESRWGLVAPSLDQRMTEAILQRSATGTEQAGWVGHRLPSLFEHAGLTGVRSISSDHTVCEHDDFFRFTHLRASAEDAALAGAVTAAQATRWLRSLSDLLKRGEAFATVLVLHVVGLTPAA